MPSISLQTVSSGYDRKTCWVHARVGVIPSVSGSPQREVITTQKLLLRGTDVFYEINTFHSEDGGLRWEGPVAHPVTMGRRPLDDERDEVICDLTPAWHQKSGVLLATGHNAFYSLDQQLTYPDGRRTCYSVYAPETRTWKPWKKLDYPELLLEGAGCTQRVDLPDGDILLPTYLRKTPAQAKEVLFSSIVMRCSFDGETLICREHGNEMTLPTGRGFVEPSLVAFGGRYFLTLRNNEAGYVSVSKDGLHFETPRPWRFDDGSELGSYNTQQHWVTGGGNLYLVYTRRGANNDHVFRHRAPLFMAQVDPDLLCVRRDTEQILVPEHGARLGNFGVAQINDREALVSVAEWMQTRGPDSSDSTVCERYGSDNRIFVARISFP